MQPEFIHRFHFFFFDSVYIRKAWRKSKGQMQPEFIDYLVSIFFLTSYPMVQFSRFEDN